MHNFMFCSFQGICKAQGYMNQGGIRRLDFYIVLGKGDIDGNGVDNLLAFLNNILRGGHCLVTGSAADDQSRTCRECSLLRRDIHRHTIRCSPGGCNSWERIFRSRSRCLCLRLRFLWLLFCFCLYLRGRFCFFQPCLHRNHGAVRQDSFDDVLIRVVWVAGFSCITCPVNFNGCNLVPFRCFYGEQDLSVLRLSGLASAKKVGVFYKNDRLSLGVLESYLISAYFALRLRSCLFLLCYLWFRSCRFRYCHLRFGCGRFWYLRLGCGRFRYLRLCCCRFRRADALCRCCCGWLFRRSGCGLCWLSCRSRRGLCRLSCRSRRGLCRLSCSRCWLCF